jgi:hypothetical protein
MAAHYEIVRPILLRPPLRSGLMRRLRAEA